LFKGLKGKNLNLNQKGKRHLRSKSDMLIALMTPKVMGKGRRKKGLKYFLNAKRTSVSKTPKASLIKKFYHKLSR